MVPVIELLIMDILNSEWIEELLPEALVLQQVQESKAVWIGDVLCVLGALPVL